MQTEDKILTMGVSLSLRFSIDILRMLDSFPWNIMVIISWLGASAWAKMALAWLI